MFVPLVIVTTNEVGFACVATELVFAAEPVMLVKPVQPEKASSAIYRTLSGIVMLVKPVQFLKAPLSIFVTLLGIVTLVKLLQPLKTHEGMVVMPFGIVTDVTSSLFRYNLLLLEPYFIKFPNPEILYHAAISVIYMS